VNLVRERFNLYYAGLFLVDQTGARTGEPNRWAVLRAGTGEAGQQMLAQSHKLEIDGESMIGWCVANQRARIALDVGTEAVRFDNPYLPHTRSELALPLVSRGQAVGAMTIQSEREAAFSDEDVATLQTMADQVVTAIENTRLLEETRSALAEVEATHSRYLRREWQEYLSQRAALRQGGFLYDQTQAATSPDDSAKLVAGLWRPEIERAVSAKRPVRAEDNGDTEPVSDLGEPGRTGLAIPIIVRGQTIGVLGVEDPAGTRQWSEEDEALMQAIGQQLGLALENARLLEDTQRRAAREQLIGEVTAHIRESLDVDTVLQTAVREMQAVLDLSEVELRMGNDTQLEPHNRGKGK
jgi:GAF domain-containing protein